MYARFSIMEHTIYSESYDRSEYYTTWGNRYYVASGGYVCMHLQHRALVSDTHVGNREGTWGLAESCMLGHTKYIMVCSILVYYG